MNDAAPPSGVTGAGVSFAAADLARGTNDKGSAAGALAPALSLDPSPVFAAGDASVLFVMGVELSLGSGIKEVTSGDVARFTYRIRRTM